MTGPNYTGDAGRFRVMHGNREVAVLASEKRRFRPSNQETTEVGLLQACSGDLYAVMGDRMNDGTRAMRIYFNPLVSLIWLGSFVMFLGGLVSLSDRRFRVGMPRLARSPCRRRRSEAMGGCSSPSFCLLLVAIRAAEAVQPDEILSDPALESRARALSAELRCLVCQNQSIDDSNAPLARDLRLLIRERLKAGDSDAQAIDFIVARYGDFVLLRPRFIAANVALVDRTLRLAVHRRNIPLFAARRGGNEAERALEPAEESALKRALDGGP